MNGQEPAFPAHEGIISIGITIRDYFAAKALQGILNTTVMTEVNLFTRIKIMIGIKSNAYSYVYNAKNATEQAYIIADQMLKERSKSNG